VKLGTDGTPEVVPVEAIVDDVGMNS